MKGKFLLLAMALCMVITVLPAAAASGLPSADGSGTITLTENVTLTDDVTLTSGQALDASSYTITSDSCKITLEQGAIVTSDVSNDLYDVLAGDGKSFVAYTDSEGVRTYICSDIVTDSSGYGVFMAGHPAEIAQYGSDPKDLQITYTHEGTEYVLRYQNANDCAAVVYGGVKDKAVDGLTTSLTLKSGTVAALVAGSKIPAYDSTGNQVADNGSVADAVITVEGGMVVGDEKCAGQPYASQGMVMGVWYTGPDIETFTFNMTGGEIVGQVFGGSATSSYKNANYEGITVNHFTANISGGTIAGDLFAGGQDVNTGENSTQTVKNAEINISGTASITQVYGGGFANWNGALAVVEQCKINLNGGTVGTIYGGGQNGLDTAYNNSATARVDNVVININSGEVAEVYGGGYNYHWVNSYWVADDGSVIKVNYKHEPISGDMTHYSDVVNSTININGGTIYGDVSLGGRSWAHVGSSTANINADVDSVSGLGNYGYVENSTINIHTGVRVGTLDLVRSGIVGNSTVTNSGIIDTLIAGAPASRYVDNMGVNKVGVLGNVTITNSGTVNNAQLTYGLELADTVVSDVPLVMTPVDYGPEKAGVSDEFQPQEHSDWGGSAVVLSAGTTFRPAADGIPPTVQFSDGASAAPDGDGSYTGKAAKVGDTYYDSLPSAIEAAMTGEDKTITLISNLTADSWDMIWNVTGITLDGSGYTIKINDIQSGQNHDAVFHSAGNNTIQDLTIDLSGIAADSQAQGYRAFSAAPGDSFTNVTVIGNGHVSYGITVGGTEAGENEQITIDGCRFINCGYGVYSDLVTNLEKLTITNSAFTGCDYASILYTEGVTFTSNTVSGGKLNIMHDAQTVTGNIFTDGSRIKFYDKPAAFEKNSISADSKLDAHDGVTGVDVSENYWGGGAPSEAQLNGVNVTGNDVYYIRDTMNPEDLNTYVAPSSASYAITVEESDNGTVTASRTRAPKGITITLTVKADEGYALDTLTVTDKNGNEIKLTDKGDGKYTFTMPSSAVTVKASFAKDDTPVETGLPFTDVKADDWFYEAVKYSYDNKLMDGTSSTTFAPLMTTNRAMIVTILWRVAGEPGVDYAMNFSDVESGVWYTEAVRWAAAEGIVKGYSDTVFAPNDTVTREQLATILYRYAQYKEYDVSAKGDLTTFADGADTSSWATEAMEWAVGSGLLSGKDGGKLDPTGTATRAEVATILMRFVESVSK